MQKLASLSCFMMFLWTRTSAEGSLRIIISAAEGQDATLPCKAPNNKTENILIVLWTKPDLGEDQYILFYRNGKVNPDNHPSYKNRVDLKDRTMKDGDVSLILKNVAFRDSGTYKCFIAQGGESNNIKLISSISLSVVPGDPEEQGGDGGHVGLSAGLTVAALVVGIFGVVMFLRHQKKKKKKKKNSPPPAAPEQDIKLSQVHSETH